MPPEVGHVPGCHPAEGEGFVVGGTEPPTELPQIPDDGLAGVGGEIVLGKEPPQEDKSA